MFCGMIVERYAPKLGELYRPPTEYVDVVDRELALRLLQLDHGNHANLGEELLELERHHLRRGGKVQVLLSRQPHPAPVPLPLALHDLEDFFAFSEEDPVS